MVQSLIKLGKHVVLHTSMVAILCKAGIRHCPWSVVVFFDADGNCEIVQSSLKVTHLVVALTSERESFSNLPVFVASLRELSECLLDFLFTWLLF